MNICPPPEAKHRHVFEVMRSRIESGDYGPGDRIPSEVRLIEEFGVSRPTIARALQDLERRGLVKRRRGAGTYVSHTNSIGKSFGLLIPGLGDTEVFEPICGEMARIAQQEGDSLIWGAGSMGLGRYQTSTKVLSSDDSVKGTIALDVCQRFIRDRVSGVFFAPFEFIPNRDFVNNRIASMLDDAKIPLVLLDRDYVPYPGRSNHDLVNINNRREGHTITNHMFAAGCRQPVFVLRPGAASTIHARAAGFAEAFLTRRIKFDFERIHECDPCDVDYIRKMLHEQKPDGIVCGNDVTAGYLLHTLDELGVRVPKDVMVGGVDDVKYGELLRVRLTTVRQPFAAIGEAAYYAMQERITRPHVAARHIMLGCELIVRDSTRPAK